MLEVVIIEDEQLAAADLEWTLLKVTEDAKVIANLDSVAIATGYGWPAAVVVALAVTYGRWGQGSLLSCY